MLKTRRDLSWLTMEQWQSYVAQHRRSSIFHHRNWLELLSEQYGFQLRIPALLAGGSIEAALPFLQTRSLRGSRKLISLPFTDYMQLLPDDSSLEELAHLIKHEFAGKVDTVVIRGERPVHGFPVASHEVFHELATSRPLNEIEKSFASSIKRNLHKAKRQNLQFQKRQDCDGIDIFYRLHVLTRRKLGVPVQAKSYFRRLYRQLIKPGLGFVGVVNKGSEPIAAVVLLGFNGRLVYKYAASHPNALHYRPNDLLVYNSIRVASEERCDFFDFGISDKNQSGLRRFKSKWGAVENEVSYCYVLGEPDVTGKQSTAVRMAGEVIKRTPTFVCRGLGKVFYKYSQ